VTAVGGIVLEVVSPKGVVLRHADLDEVVLRRREPEHERGSEIAVLPRHGPTLVQVCAHEVRYRRGEIVARVPVGPGVAEIADDVVTLIVSSAG
jgi:F0F1-type ATP synthase epsilon subunit